MRLGGVDLCWWSFGCFARSVLDRHGEAWFRWRFVPGARPLTQESTRRRTGERSKQRKENDGSVERISEILDRGRPDARRGKGVADEEDFPDWTSGIRPGFGVHVPD